MTLQAEKLGIYLDDWFSFIHEIIVARKIPDTTWNIKGTFASLTATRP
jgi:hypothetical protein